MVLGSGGEGIYVFDIHDKTAPVEYLKWKNTKLGGSVENVLLNRNDTLIFGSLRYYGYVVFDLDLANRKLTEVAEF